MQPARPDIPILRDIVLAGGGHAHALVARLWAMTPMPGVRLTIVNPGPAAPYTGMLPGHVAGHYRRDEIMIDLVALAQRAGARLILDRVTGIDRAARKVHLAGRPPLAYDLLSLDIGITSDLPGIAGFAEHGLAAKPLGPFAARWQAVAETPRSRPAQVVVVGGGVGGAELALAARHRLARRGPAPMVTILELGPRVLPGLAPRARDRLLAELAATGITLRSGARLVRVGPTEAELDGGEVLPADLVLAVAGARPQGWLAETGLELDQGFVAVDRHLRSSDPAIFAAGDCAHLSHAPRPKAGVFAVRAAPILHHNLCAALTGAALRPFAPQDDYLKLIALGDRRALAEKWGFTLTGPAMWAWKDRIDRRFMAMFALPAPTPPAPLPAEAARLPGLAEALGEKPLCGGCGAKVGAGALQGALAALPARTRPDVLRGAGDDAAVLTHGAGGVQVLTTDHLRAFTPDARLMARLAAVHALGDIWAMGAAPQAALSQIILPRLSDTKAAEMLAEITEEAAAILAREGAEIVGGHSSIGAELTIGFTLTGLAPRVIAKKGARPGDALILTKPIGTGTILAAQMSQGPAPGPGLILGECVAAAHATMSQAQGAAARALAQHAHAMTDVTGFGLAGHLIEMLEPDGLSARLQAPAIPLLPGALELAAKGTASSLAPQNRAAVLGRLVMAEGPLQALMVDPQTCGGLLAAVPWDQADSLLASLRDLGLAQASCIGWVEEGPLSLRVEAAA